MSRNSKIGALLEKTESKYEKAQAFLRTKDEDAEKAGEALTSRLLRKAARSFATNIVFTADRIGVEPTLDRILRAYLILDEREAHQLASWYCFKLSEVDAGAKALVDAARLLTTGNRPVWPQMAQDYGLEARHLAAERLLTLAVRHPNKNISDPNCYGVLAGSFVDAGLFPDDAAAMAVIDAALGKGEATSAEVEAQEGDGEGPVEVESAPDEGAEETEAATEPETPAAPVVEEPPAEVKPKRESAKARRQREAAEAAAAKDPAAGLKGDKPKKIEGGLAGLKDLNLGT